MNEWMNEWMNASLLNNKWWMNKYLPLVLGLVASLSPPLVSPRDLRLLVWQRMDYSEDKTGLINPDLSSKIGVNTKNWGSSVHRK